MTLARLSNSRYPSLPSFLDRLFEGDLMDWNTWNFAGIDSTLPAVNVKENEDDYEIEVAAPGMKKSDFKLNYDNGRLTISSERKDEKKERTGGKITRREFSYQSFQRSFSIPEHVVDADRISAKYHEGILHVTLPKHEEAESKPAKEIKVS